MKSKVIKPCEHFDIDKHRPKGDAPCHCAPACDWYHEECTEEEFNTDPQLPCLRRYEVEDTDTIDMFKEGQP